MHMLITTKTYNEHILRTKTTSVLSGNQAVEVIIALEKELSRMQNAVGLAAPQIGLPLSVAIIRHENVYINLINPVMLDGESAFIYQDEGCLSLPQRRFNVTRFGIFKIRNHLLWPTQCGAIPLEQDVNRYPVNIGDMPQDMFLVPANATYVYDNPIRDSGGTICVAVQHEMDHLNGLLLDKHPLAIEKTISGLVMIGRNDLCYCGSGKKYKKCCLPKTN